MSLRCVVFKVWVACLCFSASGWAQDCSSGIINLFNQTDVDNFQTNYGPCNRVILDLYIDQLNAVGDEITDLTPLSGLNEVVRTLVIDGNTSLTSLTGLENLTSVSRLLIEGHNNLSNFTGLSGLTTVNSITIGFNNFLDDLSGFSSSLQALDTLTIRDNVFLESLQGLPASLTSVKQLRIQDHSELISLDGLPAISNLVDLLIQDNDVLSDITALSASTISIADPEESGISIQGNRMLTNLQGMPAVQKIGNLSIQDNEELTSLAGLESLQEVWHFLSIADNPKLSDCSSLKTVLDAVDDGDPGPGTGANPDDPPDSPGLENMIFSNNLTGCDSVEEIVASNGGLIMKDGFEGL